MHIAGEVRGTEFYKKELYDFIKWKTWIYRAVHVVLAGFVVFITNKSYWQQFYVFQLYQISKFICLFTQF